jgi:UDP-glucose 4-epimerase
MKPMVLLTGGFGNLGGRVAAALNDQGRWNIRLASRSHISAPAWAPLAEVIHLDVLDAADVARSCKGVTAVVHLAALNDRLAAQDPELAEAVSGRGTDALVNAAIENNVQRFIFMSTAHVYSSPLHGVITESTPTTNQHPYATSHISGERAVAERHDKERFLGIRLRCANGFGYPMNPEVDIWHTLVYDLCKQVVATHRMTLRSSGHQQRNFIPVSDICAAILHFLQLDATQVTDGLFKLGGSTSTTVLEMATVVASRAHAVLGITATIDQPSQSMDELVTPLDYQINKLIATGFVPKNVVNEEIDRLLLVCAENQQ